MQKNSHLLSIGWKSISIFSVNDKEKIALPENQKIKVSSVKWNGPLSIFSVNSKEKIALCAYENENSKVFYFDFNWKSVFLY